MAVNPTSRPTVERDLTITADDRAVIGHNAAGLVVRCQAKLFNSIARYAGRDGPVRRLSLPAGSDIGDLLRELRVPVGDVFLVFVNGRDISPGLGRLRTGYVIEEGDVIALSGPVPYSWGYGAPVV